MVLMFALRTQDVADDTTRLLENVEINRAEHIDAGAAGRGGQSASRRQQCEQNDEDELLEEELVHTAAHITSLLKPVSLTMALVVVLVKATVEEMGGAVQQSPYLVFREEDSDDSGTRVGKALINSLVITMGMLCTTVVFFYLYKYNCSVLLMGWLYFSVAMLLGGTGGVLCYTLLAKARADGSWLPSIDVYSFTFFQLNFAVTGVVCVFGKAPLLVKQVRASPHRAWAWGLRVAGSGLRVAGLGFRV